MAEGSFRLRISYTKLGRLRYLSHLEMTRCLERCIRRAGLPFAVTQGFSPHMKHAFGWALPVGVGSTCEYADIWLTEYVESEEVLSSFEGALPEGLRITGVSYVDPRGSSLESEFPCSDYEVCFEGGVENVRQALSALLDVGSITVIRKKKEKVVRFEGLLLGTPEVSASEGDPSYATMSMRTFTEGRGSLRADLFVGEMERMAAGSIRRLSITRVAQHGDPRATQNK